MSGEIQTASSSATLSAVVSAVASTSAAAAESATSSGSTSSALTVPSSYKVIGIILAVSSGLFIGASFVVKKLGLRRAALKNPDRAAGENHAYLKDYVWWIGMTTMIVGELCNFAAYAFCDALLVAPMGSISVVICAILSHFILKEKLTLFGKVGCALCVIGSIIFAVNGPQESTTATIPEFQKLFLAPGWLVFFALVIVLDVFLIFYGMKRWGKANMFTTITICSVTGGVSVVCTSGLGGAILTSIRGNNQFKHWFMYVLLAIVVVTLLVEINYLNKALELFNTAMVTPTYFVMFSFCSILASVVLHRGFNVSVTGIVTLLMAFATICCGITLLQLSKIDPVDLQGKLDRRSTILMAAARSEISLDNRSEKALDIEDPGIDSVRGGFGVVGSIHRAISSRRSLRRDPGLDVENARRRHGPPVPMTTVGTEGLVRHQLYDNPMPSDALDKISMHSGNDRQMVTSPGPISPGLMPWEPEARPRSSTITFAPADTVHTYARKPGSSATHAEQARVEGSHTHHYPGQHPSRLPTLDFGDPAGDVGDASASGLPSYYNPYERVEHTEPSSGGLSLADILRNRKHSDSDAAKSQKGPRSPTSPGHRFHMPFKRMRTSSGREGSETDHRVQHPAGPADLDAQESEGLVRREDEDDDQNDDEGTDSEDGARYQGSYRDSTAL